MLRSGTITTIEELATQGKSIREIARTVGVARNTVRSYLRGKKEAVPRPKRGSLLDPYKSHIRTWVQQDHLYNCETMLLRLREMGYRGSATILRDFVRPLRPRQTGHSPLQREETQPGEQMQFDWGAFHYEYEGQDHKVYGFTAILSYSRMRFTTFVKRCDAPTMIRSLMQAFEYFGGLPKAALTDRRKSVFLDMDGNTPRWHPLFADFMASLGVSPHVWKPESAQTKGKVEKSVEVIKSGFWPGVHFTDIDHLNQQATIWCDQLNQQVHQTTRQVPRDVWVQEHLSPLPIAFAWQQFGAEERRVSWGGFISYDGVSYRLPSEPVVAGSVVLVRERGRELHIYHQGQLITTLVKCPRSHEMEQQVVGHTRRMTLSRL